MKKLSGIVVMIMTMVCLCSSCSVTLSGASIPGTMKTIYVGYFENTSQLVVTNLSQIFTDALKNRIRSQTRLVITQNPEVTADKSSGSLTGTITNYSYAPVSVQATNNNQAPIANATRLSITVNVKYTNEANPKYNYEQQFTRYIDFTGDLAAQEQTLIQRINQQLTEDIFNRAFANW
ncbi:LptE family protein [Mucilaginibacter koreensis]